jgi:hypothetical protein
MVFLLLVVFGFSTKPLTMIRLFAELSGHYQSLETKRRWHNPKPAARAAGRGRKERTGLIPWGKKIAVALASDGEVPVNYATAG